MSAKKVLGLTVICLIVSSTFLPFIKANPGLEFEIIFLDIDKVITRRYYVGETVKIYAQVKNTGSVTIDPYRLEGVFTITSPSSSQIDAGTDWNTNWLDPGQIDLLKGSWTVPSDAEVGWYAIKVVITSKDTGLTRLEQKDNAFEIPMPNVYLRSRAYDGATNVGVIEVIGVGAFNLPADIFLEDGEYSVVGSGDIFDGNRYDFDSWEGRISDPSRPDTTLTVSGETTLTLVLFKWNFTLDVFPTSRTVKQEDGATYDVTVTATGGWTTYNDLSISVDVEILDLPNETTQSFSGYFPLSQSNPSDTHTATIYTSNTTPVDTYQITFKGTITSTTTTHNQTVELVVEPKEGPPPDLIIEDFWWSPTNPEPGDEVTFTYIEKNQGEGDASAHRNTLLIDDIPISNDVVEALAAGSSRTRTFPDKWIATSGAHDALVKADDQNAVTESDEENNFREEIIGEKEQVSTSLTISLNPSSVQPNKKVWITISGRLTRIDTGGGIPDRPVRLDWHGGLTTVTTNADGNYSYSTDVGPYEEGTYEFTANFEGYETTSTIFLPSIASNTLQVTVGDPDLTITDISWSPSDPVVGDSVNFSYIVENQGIKGTTDFTTAIYIDGERIDISARTSLAAGETKTRSFTYAWTATEGSHEIKVVADDLDEISESDESNNQMSKTLTFQSLREPMCKVSNIFAPLSVSVGMDFYISVIMSYSFISETNVRIRIWDYNNQKQIAVKEDTLSSDGFKTYHFALTALSHVGTWRLVVNASYLQNGSWKQETVEGEYYVSINVVEGEVPVANFRVTPLYFDVEYEGEIYKIFLTENLTASRVAPNYEDTDVFYKWMYSKFNWYVLDSNNNLVTDKSVYLDVAFAAQIAYQGISTWLPENLRVRSEQFTEVIAWGVRAEFVKKVGGIAAGMIPRVLIGGAPTITKEIVSQTLAQLVAKGFTDPEVLFTLFFADNLKTAAEKLESAAGFIEPVYEAVLKKGFPQGVSVSQSDVMEFYYNVTWGLIHGYSAMGVFEERFNDGIWGYLKSIIKDAVLANLPVSETADLIKIWIADLTIQSGEFRSFWEKVEKMDRFYDMREKTFMASAKNFFEILTGGEAFATLVSAQTPSGEEVIFLVSTNSTILSKYVSTTEKSIKIDVEGPAKSGGALQSVYRKTSSPQMSQQWKTSS